MPVAHRVVEKGHGRRESRTLQLTGVRAGIGFPHARLAGRIVRNRTETATGETTQEIVYVVTSLGWPDITPAGLAGLIRGHWSIGRVAPAHCCAGAPSEPGVRLSPHPAQASVDRRSG